MEVVQGNFLRMLGYVQSHPWLAIGYVLSLACAFEYWKVIPLVYHLRTIATMVQGFISPGLKSPQDEVRSHHNVRLSDRDWNGHQNNSCYNLEIDIVRYLWIIRFMKHSPKWRSWFNEKVSDSKRHSHLVWSTVAHVLHAVCRESNWLTGESPCTS